MRKTYSLHIEGKNRDRLIEASKHDIRKYVKRERSRPLPDGTYYYIFKLNPRAETQRGFITIFR